MEKREPVFVVGPEASGDSFIGREDYVEELEKTIFDGHGSIHLVGVTRIGKSSLIKRVLENNQDRPGHIQLLLKMGDYSSAFHFWLGLFFTLREELRDREMWSARLEQSYQDICVLKPEDGLWYMQLHSALERALRHVKKQGQHVVLVIDEFDAVTQIFEDKPYYYQLLRSIYSDKGTYHVCGALLSRRRLEVLEVETTCISTFHGVFDSITLREFNDRDMEEFFRILEECGVRMTEDGVQQLKHFTGNIPYLCCMFASRLTADDLGGRPCGRKEIDAVFRECLTSINRYYDDLIRRLQKDDQLETLLYLSFGFTPPEVRNQRVREHMFSMGCLSQGDPDDLYPYFAYSQDFMEYLKLQPLNLPVWDLIMACESKLKGLIVKEFPELGKPYQEICCPSGTTPYLESLGPSYQRLNLHWTQIYKYCDSLSAHKETPAAIDGITFSSIIHILTKDSRWETIFRPYFEGDSEWKARLEEIRNIRNPIAHAHEEDIDETRKSVCSTYCEELLKLPF